MEKDKRAGICNVSKDLGKDVIYILPPSLKKSITALRYVRVYARVNACLCMGICVIT